MGLRAYRGQFLLLGLFRPRPGDLSRAEAKAFERRAVLVSEPEDLRRAIDGAVLAKGPAVVRFEGYRGFFAPLRGWSRFLHEELRVIAKPGVLARVDRLSEVPIAINVRCGNDFPSAPPGARRLPPGTKTPVPWFRDVLRLVRAGASSVPAAFVVSDGTPEQLRLLLDEPAVTLVRPGTALSDLLTLARARVLLASGSSSFSAWGAFLGRMPAASHPGQPLSEWKLEGDPDGDPVRAEVDPESPDAAFMEAAGAALARR